MEDRESILLNVECFCVLADVADADIFYEINLDFVARPLLVRLLEAISLLFKIQWIIFEVT